MRFAHFLRGICPSHVPIECFYPMRLLGDDLNLIEFKLDGGLAAEHRYDHVHRVVVDLNTLDSAGEAAQGAVEDPDSIAHCVVDDDFLLLNTHCVNFIFGQGNGIVAGSTNNFAEPKAAFDEVTPLAMALYEHSSDRAHAKKIDL